MVGPAEIENYMTGVWMLARNDRRGFGWLDLSADGFWRSFTAIVYAFPAFAISWASYRAAYVAAAGEAAATGLGLFLRLALIDITNWLAPILIVALIAVPLGLSTNFGRWVVATNWLSLPVAYAMAIPVALTLLIPGFEPVGVIVALVFFGFAVAIFFRLTRLSFNNDVPVAIAITVGLVILSFAMTAMLQAAFGLAFQPRPA